MKLKRAIGSSLYCIMMIVCLPIKAHASGPCCPIIHMEDMKWEQVDPQSVAILTDSSVLRNSDSISGTIAAHSVSVDRQALYLSSDSTITFNCSYSPSSANMDFGVIAPDGKFYYIEIKGGSIYQAIRVDQTGSYTVAIRNNSSQTVRVIGFVNY